MFSSADINLRLANIDSDCRFVHYATCLARTIKGTGTPFSAVAAVGISVAGFILFVNLRSLRVFNLI